VLGGFNDFIARDNTFVTVSGALADNDFEFSDNVGEDEYNSLMSELKPKQISLVSIEEDYEEAEVNVDDI
jgi:hypothetical protein